MTPYPVVFTLLGICKDLLHTCSSQEPSVSVLKRAGKASLPDVSVGTEACPAQLALEEAAPPAELLLTGWTEGQPHLICFWLSL